MADLKIGKIIHYFDKIGLAVVEVLKSFKAGDTIKISGHDNEFTQTIINTQGVEVHWQETLFSAVLELKAEQDTKVQVGGESQSRRFFGDLDFEKLVEKMEDFLDHSAVERAKKDSAKFYTHEEIKKLIERKKR